MRKLDSPDRLVHDGLLRTADVLLMHTRRSPRASLIRRTTRSYWNHALLIQVATGGGAGPDRTLIVDPKMSGLEVDEVAYYLRKPDRYDAAVKRFEAGWFVKQDENGRSGPQRVLDLALKKVYENRVSSSRWHYVMRFMRQLKLLVPPRGRDDGAGKAGIETELAAPEPVDVAAYTCSGFVQWCYYQTILEAVRQRRENASKLAEVIFNPRLSGRTTADRELLSTTPGDLAQSQNLSWKYVIKDGTVWEVSNSSEVQQIFQPEGLAQT